MQLTPEQRAVVEAGADPSRPHLTVVGYAGTAKTTTMLAMAKAKGDKGETGSAFFFNRAMADEMRGKIISDGICGLSASTLHSLAFRSMKRPYGARVGAKMLAADIASHLQFGRVVLPCLSIPITPTGAAYIAMRSLAVYCQSSDERMMKHHLRAGNHEVALYRDRVRAALKPHSERLAKAVFDPAGTLAMSHDVYLKWYIEDVAKGVRAGPVGDYLIGDEFQDSNGVTMKLMETMAGRGSQIVVAGDPYQQIYQWRGSVDAMSRMQTDRRLELTQSFRFGQPLADLASAVLHRLGATVHLTGNPAVTTEILTQGSGNFTPQAMICRTNVGAMEEAAALVQSGRSCYLPRARSMIDIIDDIEALHAGGRAQRTDLRVFNSYDSFLEHADKSSDGAEYKRLLKMIEEQGFQSLRNLLRSCEAQWAGAVTLMTAHASKGLQFESVALGSDFPTDKDLAEKPETSAEEIRLMYVAATRAQRRLDLSRCGFLKGLHASEGISGSAAQRSKPRSATQAKATPRAKRKALIRRSGL